MKENYKMIAINLNKQQALDVDPKAIQQTNFTGNLNQAAGAFIFFFFLRNKRLLDFSQRAVKVF